jgi:hypothetical protein
MNKLLRLSGLLLLLSSCSPRIFLPDRVNAPMLREAGEVKLTTSAKIQGQAVAPGLGWSPSLDLSGSPLQGLGLMFSYRNTNKYANEDNWMNNRDAQDSIHYWGRRFEFGAGHYLTLGRKGVFDIYGGGGFGDISRRNLRNGSGNYNADYFRIFIQPAVGFVHKDFIEFGGGMRFTYQRYNQFNSGDPDLRFHFTRPAADITRVNLYLIEPFINCSFGYKFIKFNIQPGFSNNINTPAIDNSLSFYLSMGLTFQFAPRFLKG